MVFQCFSMILTFRYLSTFVLILCSISLKNDPFGLLRAPNGLILGSLGRSWKPSRNLFGLSGHFWGPAEHPLRAAQGPLSTISLNLEAPRAPPGGILVGFSMILQSSKPRSLQDSSLGTAECTECLNPPHPARRAGRQ